jgi:hypothetical protein
VRRECGVVFATGVALANQANRFDFEGSHCYWDAEWLGGSGLAAPSSALEIVKLTWTKPGTRNGRKAYTLAEVMIAVLLIALMTVSLYGGISSGFSIIQLARENLRATQILMQRMETIRLYTWHQVNDPTYLKPTFVERYDPLGVSTNAGGAVYNGVISLSTPASVPAAYQTNMRLLTVTLYWTNATRSAKIVRTRQMQTHIARNGMQNYIWGVP